MRQAATTREAEAVASDTGPVTVIDVASLPPGTCGRHIVSSYERLLPGEAMEFVVDHDPAPLRQRFAVERPGESDWAYLEFGPRVWRVRVKRLV